MYAEFYLILILNERALSPIFPFYFSTWIAISSPFGPVLFPVIVILCYCCGGFESTSTTCHAQLKYYLAFSLPVKNSVSCNRYTQPNIQCDNNIPGLSSYSALFPLQQIDFLSVCQLVPFLLFCPFWSLGWWSLMKINGFLIHFRLHLNYLPMPLLLSVTTRTTFFLSTLTSASLHPNPNPFFIGAKTAVSFIPFPSWV